MRTLKHWVVALAVSGATLMGTSCATDFRDAALTGVLNYVTDTTTGLLTTVSPIDDATEGTE